MSGLYLAYIDAGTGSALLQILIAGLFTVFCFFGQIKNYLRGHFQSAREAADEKRQP